MVIQSTIRGDETKTLIRRLDERQFNHVAHALTCCAAEGQADSRLDKEFKELQALVRRLVGDKSCKIAH